MKLSITLDVFDILNRTKPGSFLDKLKEFKLLQIPLDANGIYIKDWHHTFSSENKIIFEGVEFGINSSVSVKNLE